MICEFNDGGTMPALGLGTWTMDDAEAERVVATAIGLGYRLIDTAFNYKNETGVGRGVAASGVPREDIFITSKFNREWHSVAGVVEAWEGSVRRLGVDYLDLFLIHWPNPDQDSYALAWEGLIALREQGKVKHIGTSNFLPEHHDRIITATGVTPALDQIQVNPRWSQPEVRAYNREHGIITQAWSPLGQGNDLLQLPLLAELAESYGVTPAQIVLAWDLELGLGVVAKSSNRERLIENLEAAEIMLTPDDMARISALDGTVKHWADPNSFGH